MKIAIVRLRESGQLATYQINEDAKVNNYVIVEADRGIDYGEIMEIIEIIDNPDVIKYKDSSLKNVI